MLLVPKNIEQKGTTFVNFVLCKIGAAYKNCIFGHVCGAVKMLQTHLTQLKHKWTSAKYYIYLHKKNQLHPTLSQNVVFCNIWQFLTYIAIDVLVQISYLAKFLSYRWNSKIPKWNKHFSKTWINFY